MNKVFIALLIPFFLLTVYTQESSAGEKEICEAYCKKPRAWPKKGLRYQPRGRLCGGQPTIIAKGYYANLFSLVGRNAECGDRSNPALSQPSDYKPKFRGALKNGQFFCFENKGQYKQTVSFSIKLFSAASWGRGVECFKVKNIRQAMPIVKKKNT